MGRDVVRGAMSRFFCSMVARLCGHSGGSRNPSLIGSGMNRRFQSLIRLFSRDGMKQYR